MIDPSPLATSSPLVHGFAGRPPAAAPGAVDAELEAAANPTAGTRRAGVLVHVTSLPGPDGVGDIGRTAREFVSWLAGAGQRLWAFLPLNPPAGTAMSPYDTSSAFAGNPLLISLDDLAELGLLPDTLPSIRSSVHAGTAPGIQQAGGGDPDDPITRTARWKLPLLRQAARQLLSLPPTNELTREYIGFCAREGWWLADHVAFTALREKYPGVSRSQWPDGDRVQRLGAQRGASLEIGATHRHPEAAIQFFFDLQARRLHTWAQRHDVWLMGDVPIYVGNDSADVWAHPELFLLDAERRPAWTTGAPPDEFDRRGQVWGLPAYDWEENRRSGFEWWLRRLQAAARYTDVLRIDHFRAFADWWRVPVGALYGDQGTWQPGPGASFFAAVERELGDLELVVEDLGMATEPLERLRAETGLPQMRVIVQGFDEGGGSVHLPTAWRGNEAAYTATHDFHTVRSWADATIARGHEERLAFAMRFTGAGSVDELVEASIASVLGSRARFAIVGLPDWLGLGAAGRVNVPGTSQGNWRWQAPRSALDEALADRMANATANTDRA